jgi:hypothetical protein
MTHDWSSGPAAAATSKSRTQNQSSAAARQKDVNFQGPWSTLQYAALLRYPTHLSLDIIWAANSNRLFLRLKPPTWSRPPTSSAPITWWMGNQPAQCGSELIIRPAAGAAYWTRQWNPINSFATPRNRVGTRDAGIGNNERHRRSPRKNHHVEDILVLLFGLCDFVEFMFFLRFELPVGTEIRPVFFRSIPKEISISHGSLP